MDVVRGDRANCAAVQADPVKAIEQGSALEASKPTYHDQRQAA